MSATLPPEGAKASLLGSSEAHEAASAGAIPRIEAVNDFVIKFANVNGSGSASANELFAKAIPVSYTHLTLPTNREV